METHPRYHQRHHRPSGFANIWNAPEDAPFWRVMTWLASRALRRKHNVPAPVAVPELPVIHSIPSRIRVTWIGHASFLIQMEGMNILLDPVFSYRASPFTFMGPRREPLLPLTLADLPHIDIVVVSHDHYDHLDRRAIRALEAHSSPSFFAPLGVAKILQSFGASEVVEMDWWQFAAAGRLTLHCLPARHFSGRELHNRNGTMWSSWYLSGPIGNVYFAGDSGYADHFHDIRKELGPPDVALLPIGAYLPRWIMAPIHMSPEEALQAFVDLEARFFVPTHWGTFDLADEPIHEPISVLRAAVRRSNQRVELVNLDVGESWELTS